MSSPSDPIKSSVSKVVQPTATASSVRVSGPSNFFYFINSFTININYLI